MRLFAEFTRRAPNKVFISIVLGALAGIAYALLIPLVLSSLDAPNDHLGGRSGQVDTILGFEVFNYKFAVLFLFACVFILIARSVSQIMLLNVSLDFTSELRIRVYRRISRAPIAQLERLGSARLIAVLGSDVSRMVMGAKLLPDLLISIVTLLGMLGFLLYLNATVFGFVMGAILFGLVTYQLPMLVGRRYFDRSRAAFWDLQEAIRGLIEGAKELKLNDEKRDNFFREALLASESEIQKYDKRASTIVRTATNYGDLISFFVIGSIIFVFVNYHAITASELAGVVMALLYVTGPVSSILNIVPQVLVARVSLRALVKVLDELPEEVLDPEQQSGLAWNSIHFRQTCFQHKGLEGKGGFQVGPVSFEIARGDITFIVGGNGSGKSTLSKLITLHYLPTSGAIAFGDTPVHSATLGMCRQQICAIFSDYHLFDRLWISDEPETQRRIDDYLNALQLQHKVTIKDGRFSTLALSDGQRRRLALLAALMEDRDLYLFDEWAADQDAAFKEVFYNKLLPELKARNKAVVVISHDERYFGVADKILVMEDGRLADVQVCNTHTIAA